LTCGLVLQGTHAQGKQLENYLCRENTRNCKIWINAEKIEGILMPIMKGGDGAAIG
jgi:hypothetical protein